VLAFALGVTACSGDDAAPPASTGIQVTTTTAAPRPSDGVLSIGVLLPTTGPGAGIGQPMGDAIEAAIAEVNAAGGVLGQPVLWTQADEAIEGSLADLIEQGVDAVIGPASSLVALSQLDIAVQSGTGRGVVVCSPTATALALDDYPDDGYFFRTVPSDSMQMEAIAQEARQTGVSTISIAYLDDPYGRGLAEALAGRIGQADVLTLIGQTSFSGVQEDLSEAAAAAVAGNPGVVVVLADADDGGRFLSALDQVVDHDSPPAIIVNDSVRNARQAIAGLDPDVRARLTAVAPRAVVDDVPGFFAANAVDCVNLIALAVARAQSDRPIDFRRNIGVVSFGGRPCSVYADCAALLQTVDQIDYDGKSGPVDLRGLTGDVSRAIFDVFGFASDGSETDLETRDVSL
jgi:branched-chain amino acid transport system substrate-binding protein